jgi:hypothetical protein
MAEAGAVKGKDLRLEDRPIWSRAPLDHTWDVVWLDFAAPHKHMVVDVSVISARTNSNIMAVGDPLPLHSSLAFGTE